VQIGSISQVFTTVAWLP